MAGGKQSDDWYEVVSSSMHSALGCHPQPMVHHWTHWASLLSLLSLVAILIVIVSRPKQPGTPIFQHMLIPRFRLLKSKRRGPQPILHCVWEVGVSLNTFPEIKSPPVPGVWLHIPVAMYRHLRRGI